MFEIGPEFLISVQTGYFSGFPKPCSLPLPNCKPISVGRPSDVRYTAPSHHPTTPRCTVEIRRLSVLAFTKYCSETPLAHSLFPKMKVDFKKQSKTYVHSRFFMSPQDSPRLIFCILWLNYAYRTQDAHLKKSECFLFLGHHGNTPIYF